MVMLVNLDSKFEEQKHFPTGVLKICSKLKGEHPCLSVIVIKLQSKFNGITLPHGCSPVNLQNTFQSIFLQEHLWGNTSVGTC